MSILSMQKYAPGYLNSGHNHYKSNQTTKFL